MLKQNTWKTRKLLTVEDITFSDVLLWYVAASIVVEHVCHLSLYDVTLSATDIIEY